MISLGTNVNSLLCINQLNKNTGNLQTTMERLTTGLKINSAKDDAAGLVISENMKADTQASQQAMYNIQNGESALSVAESGMSQISDYLKRINDLLTNMANDTNSHSSRAASAEEIVERFKEINRLCRSTSFNEKVLLDGSQTEFFIQLGPDETVDSCIDIAPALGNCFTSAGGLDVEIPVVLNPKAGIDDSGDYWVIQADGTYRKCDEDGNYDAGTAAKTTPPTGWVQGNVFNPTNENCRAYMGKVQTSIDTLAFQMGLLGAYENRMESSYDSLNARKVALQESISYYTDTDIAETASNLTKNQILQQFSVSMLATANSLPQQALALVGG